MKPDLLEEIAKVETIFCDKEDGDYEAQHIKDMFDAEWEKNMKKSGLWSFKDQPCVP